MIPSRCKTSGLAVVAATALAVPAAAHAASPPAARGGAATQYYVSLGDSYAVGYQPRADGSPGAGTRDGFAYVLPRLAAKKGWRLRLVQFGCPGATSASILEQKGCPAPGPGGRAYLGTTQVAAAERFIRRNRRRVGLITVSIGGNDVTACVSAPNPTLCVANAAAPLRANVRTLLRRIRRAAGPRVRIVGTTYPDVILGAWLAGEEGRTLATLSVGAFQTVINPTLRQEYEAVRARFVDVTAATGAYIPLDQTTTVEPFGPIPVAVARVCELTWFCAFQDIHARASGYRVIAQLIARTLPKQKPAKPKPKRKARARR